MAGDTHSKLIQFLTSPANLPSVLAILRRREEIHTLAISGFWTRLQKQLASKVRTIVQSGVTPHWIPDWRENPMAKWHGLRLYLGGSQNQIQALHFRLEQTVQKDEYSLNLGLNWKDEVKPTSSVLRVSEVRRVAEEEQRLEFEFDSTKTWWHGRKQLVAYVGLDEFLEEYVEQPKPLLQKIAEPFWRHVEDTHKLVMRANRAIAARGR
jgi:hypothetical protein